jgi:hypothetical protein
LPVRKELEQLAFARLAAIEFGLELERRAHARDQLDAVERLADVVVGARQKGIRQAVHVIERRDHDDRSVDIARIGADARAGLDPVHLRHHDVEQHDVSRGRAVAVTADIEELDRLPSRRRGCDIVVAAAEQRSFDDVTRIFGIVDYQNAHADLSNSPYVSIIYMIGAGPLIIRNGASGDSSISRQFGFWYTRP